MQIQLEMPQNLESQLKAMILSATREAMEINKKQIAAKDWMSIQEACKYANVSNVTFQKFRAKGLRIAEIDGIKRVSKKEINRFLEKYSY